MGRPCTLIFAPAVAGTGIEFRRSDRPNSKPIPARVEVSVDAERRTQLGTGEESLHTVEHVLAAVGALGIDDLTIIMDGPEPPIMDGSAAPFFDALQNAGIVGNGGRPEYLVLRKPIRVIEGDSVYDARPCVELSLDVSIDFPHPLIGHQSGRFRITPELFARELAGARTFGFVHEVEGLRAKGLIQGASTANVTSYPTPACRPTPRRWPLRHLE